MFGEITLLEIIEKNQVISTDAKIYGYLLTAIYMFLANILLLNLLIAMFSNTFNNVEQNANEIIRDKQSCKYLLNILKRLNENDENIYKFMLH